MDSFKLKSRTPIQIEGTRMTDDYLEGGERRAYELGNRGPIEFDANGILHENISEAYWRTGFYVFEGVVQGEEMDELIADFEHLLTRAPTSSAASTDAAGQPAIGAELEKPSFRFAKPLSDPYGGTWRYGGKMTELEAPVDAPEEIVLHIASVLQLMDSCLRLYGHPQLLSVVEQINGPDFATFNETIWVKHPGLGASVAWHQDGTTHWDNPELDRGTHGFNYFAQLYPTNPTNALWVVPGTHQQGKLDIAGLIQSNGGSDRLPDAVPMLSQPGDVVIMNRQVLHGSFPNTSPAMRATYQFGFHRRASLLGVKGWGAQKESGLGFTSAEPYDEARIHERSRIIALAIDARHQRFPHEPRYQYQPLADELDTLRWNNNTRELLLKNYNLKDMSI